MEKKKSRKTSRKISPSQKKKKLLSNKKTSSKNAKKKFSVKSKSQTITRAKTKISPSKTKIQQKIKKIKKEGKKKRIIKKPKKNSFRKRNSNQKTKKENKKIRKPNVSNFEFSKNKSEIKKNNNWFLMNQQDDKPILNFQSDFLKKETNVDDLLEEVEISNSQSDFNEDLDDNFTINNPLLEVDKENKLEKLIYDEYLNTENIIKNDNYRIELKEDKIAINKSKRIQKKSQHLVNLRTKKKDKKQEPILDLDSNFSKIPQKKTIKSISTSYFRELLFLISNSKFYKFINFVGENIINYFFYVLSTINIFLKILLQGFFNVLIFINSFGQKISFLFKEKSFIKKTPKSKDNFSLENKIISWKKGLSNFNLFSVFKLNSIKIYSQTLSFLLIALIFIAAVQGMALFGKFNDSKGKVLGISEQAIGEFEEGIKSISDADFSNAQNSFLNANQKFIEAENEISNYNNIFIEILKFVPQQGKKIDYGIKFLNAGRLFSEAAGHISLALEQQNKKLNLTDKIKLIAENLSKSKKELKQVARDISNFNVKLLPQRYQDNFLSIQKNIPIIINNLDDLDSVSKVILDILGAKEPKRYLMIFQNSNELRPTGGFMGSLALLDIKHGKIEKIKVPKGGPYDLKAGFFENIISPKPLWLINPNFNFWDANWFIDFPTSSELILKYWEKSGGPTVDGLIAINSDVMVNFLKIIGSIRLEDRNLEINSNNFIEKVQEIVEVKDVGKSPKAIIGEMMSKILDKVFNDQKLDYLQILKLFNDSVHNKDIQVYFSDASLESTVNNYGWSGAISDTSGDYLAVVNTNIGGGKSDEFVKEKIHHQVNIMSNGTIIDTLKIDRSYIAETNNRFSKDNNRTYLRIYVPQGSKLLEASGFDSFPEDEYMNPLYGSEDDLDIINIQGRYVIDEISGVKINSEFNKTVFSAWQDLAPGQKKVVILKYELPFKLDLSQNVSLLDRFFKKDDSLSLDTYTMFYEKQSGKKAKLDLSYQWPKNIDLVWSNISKNNFQIDFNENKIIGFILKK